MSNDIRVTFEPGDGIFEVILGATTPVPRHWNKLGVTILREVDPILYTYQVLKDQNTILEIP